MRHSVCSIPYSNFQLLNKHELWRKCHAFLILSSSAVNSFQIFIPFSSSRQRRIPCRSLKPMSLAIFWCLNSKGCWSCVLSLFSVSVTLPYTRYSYCAQLACFERLFAQNSLNAKCKTVIFGAALNHAWASLHDFRSNCFPSCSFLSSRHRRFPVWRSSSTMETCTSEVQRTFGAPFIEKRNWIRGSFGNRGKNCARNLLIRRPCFRWCQKLDMIRKWSKWRTRRTNIRCR